MQRTDGARLRSNHFHSKDGYRHWTRPQFLSGMVVLIAAGLVAGSLAGCGDNDKGGSPAESAATRAPTAAKPSDQASGERSGDHASATVVPVASPAAVTASPAATPRPVSSPKAETTSPKQDSPAPREAKRSPDKPSDTPPQPSKEQARAEELSRKGNLPSPPNLSTLPEGFVALFVNAIDDAANKPTAETLGRLGCLYMTIAKTRDDYERPISCLERAESIDPTSYRWPYYLGRVFFQRESFERARTEFLKVLELEPDFAMANAWIGEIELLRGGSNEAKAAFEAYVSKRPDDGYGYVGLANAELQLENFDAAAAALEKAQERLPDSARAAVLLAEVYEHRGDVDKASELRAQRGKLVEMPLRLHRDSLELELWTTLGPTNLAVQRVAAVADTGRLRDADLLANTLMEKYPQSAELITGIADVKRMHNELDRAIGLAERALVVQSNYAPAEVVMANCYLAKADYAASLEHADKAIALDATFIPGHASRGRALMGLERREEAVESLQRAAKLDPEEPLYQMFAGDALAASERWPEAKAAYEETLRRIESSGRIQPETFGVFTMLARIEYRDGDIDSAISHLKRALRFNPQSEATLGALTDLLIEADRSEEAIGICRQILRRAPRNDLYRQALGKVLLRAGQVDEALTHTRSWMADSPKDVNALLLLSAVQLEQNERDAAMQTLREAIDLRPKFLPVYLQLMGILMSAEPPDWNGAIEVLREGLKNIPDSAAMQNSLAWILATHSDATKRAPEEAVRLAEQACDATERKQANLLDTLACAYAAAGRFAEAIEVEKQAIELLKQQGGETAAGDFTARLELFEKGQAYVEE